MTSQENKQLHPDDENKSWRQWDTNTYLLIVGLLLFNIAVFAQPALLDYIIIGTLRALDFRLWPLWYFLVLLVIVAFSVKWFLLAKAWYDEGFDDNDHESASKFLLMSVTITAELLILVVLHATALLQSLSWPLWIWLQFGTYSNMAMVAFFLAILAVIVTFYITKEWLAFVLRPK